VVTLYFLPDLLGEKKNPPSFEKNEVWGIIQVSRPHARGFHHLKDKENSVSNVPKAPPISAPLVGMLTFTMPQSDPFGLQR